MTRGGSGQGGVTAQVVVTPIDEQGTFSELGHRAGRARRAAAAAVRAAARAGHQRPGGGARRPHPAWREATVSAGRADRGGPGAVPDARAELSSEDLDDLNELGDRRTRAPLPLRIELGGDLFYAFAEPETGTGELIGLVVAVVILLLGFGSVVAMGCRSAWRSSASPSGSARCR